jgi:hypothetical protein
VRAYTWGGYAVPKKKRADVPAIRPQLAALSDLVGESAGDPFDDAVDSHDPPVRRGPAWELAVIAAAVEELDRQDPGSEEPLGRSR